VDDKVDKKLYEKGMNSKLDKDDIFPIMQEFASKDDRIKAMHETLQEVTKRLEHLDNKIDRKILKLKKDLDLTSIQKLLKSKADDNEVKKEFENLDFRVKSANDSMSSVKKDLDGMFTSLKKITDVITLLQQDQANAIGSTRNALCLSCGRGDATFLPPMKQTKGTDGNFYVAYQQHKVNGKIVTGKEDIDYGKAKPKLRIRGVHEERDSEGTREGLPRASGLLDGPSDHWGRHPGRLQDHKDRLNERQKFEIKVKATKTLIN
jgi:hypothetical protein